MWLADAEYNDAFGYVNKVEEQDPRAHAAKIRFHSKVYFRES